MKLKVLDLSQEERVRLLEIVEKGRDWRMLHRAQTLLYFGDAWIAKAIAAKQDLHVDTVCDRRRDWLSEGSASLADKSRCGAPSQVSETQREQLRLWATVQALKARQLVTKLSQEFDITMHPNTLER